MPTLIPRACRKRGCRGTTTDRSGYCLEHIGESWSQHQRGQSRHQRGYGAAWTKLREQTLKRDRYICQQCLRDGHPSPASTVDHIKAKAHGGTDHPDNLESLCVPCHKAKTSLERMKITIK